MLDPELRSMKVEKTKNIEQSEPPPFPPPRKEARLRIATTKD